MTEIPNASDTLTGSITLRVGSGTGQTISLPSGGGTLATLASEINSSGVGVTASVLTDSSGSRLSLVSGTSGAKGTVAVASSSIVDTNGIALQYSGSAGSGTSYSSGALTSLANAADTLSGTLSIQEGNGVAQQFTLDTSDNTLGTLASTINQAGIGVTALVVTTSDGSSSLSLVSGTQGSAGTLAVTSSVLDASPSLAYTSTVSGSDASLTVDGVNLTSASNTVTNLIPGLTFQLLSSSPEQSDGSLEPVQVVIANDNSGVESAISSMVNDYNPLIAAINTQEGNDSSGNPEPLFGSPTLSLLQQQLLSSLNAQNPNGYLDPVSAATDTTLTGNILVTVGSGAQQEVDVPTSPDNTIQDLANAINAANIGVSANVVTQGGQSNLMLQSQTTGTNGALSVVSQIAATSDTPLTYAATTAGGSSPSSGTLTAVASAGDVLTGSVSIQVGSGVAETVSLGSGGGTLQDLADAINNVSGLGAIASVSSDGTTLTLTSQSAADDGALTVTSNILDSTDATTTNLNYTNSSDISTLSSLGISMNSDGTLTFDASTLDSLLNTDFTSVVGLFQGVNSWGASFASMLNNSGTSSSTGILNLAQTSNSNIESTLNADISKEETLISAQQTSLTNELNQANQILQELPSQLNGIDELYSAITGYNQSQNG